MFNRYVDGLATVTPGDPKVYDLMGQRMARDGYVRPAGTAPTDAPCLTSRFPTDLPGIRGPMTFRPETAKPINEMVDVLLRGPHTLSPGERELIATFVSSRERLPATARRSTAPSRRIT